MREPCPASALLAVLCAIIGPAVAGPVAHAKGDGCRAEAIRAQLFERDRGRVLVVAHRGAHDVEPENPLPAIERAIALGVAVVELDVRRTRDGHYVLMHDSTVDRTTDHKGKVSDLDWAELRHARLRTRDGRLTAARVPSFAEALDAARGRIWIMIDSKVDRPQDVAEIMAIARSRQMLGQTILYDYELDVLAAYRRLAPEAKVLARTKDAARIPEVLAIARPSYGTSLPRPPPVRRHPARASRSPGCCRIW